MLAGRATALWASLIQAVLNVLGLIIVVATKQPLTVEIVALFAGLNTLGLAIIGILANVLATGTAFGSVYRRLDDRSRRF
jgi:hypothetical protein